LSIVVLTCVRLHRLLVRILYFVDNIDEAANCSGTIKIFSACEYCEREHSKQYFQARNSFIFRVLLQRLKHQC